MPSHHSEDGDLPAGVSAADIRGNDHADKLAGEAAKRAAVPLRVSYID